MPAPAVWTTALTSPVPRGEWIASAAGGSTRGGMGAAACERGGESRVARTRTLQLDSQHRGRRAQLYLLPRCVRHRARAIAVRRNRFREREARAYPARVAGRLRSAGVGSHEHTWFAFSHGLHARGKYAVRARAVGVLRHSAR